MYDCFCSIQLYLNERNKIKPIEKFSIIEGTIDLSEMIQERKFLYIHLTCTVNASKPNALYVVVRLLLY